jgi:hypothetical protein
MTDNRYLFETHVYTSLEIALKELANRTILLDVTAPEYFKNKKTFVMFRHIATPNFEIHRFLSICDATNMTPVIIEYPQDKFVPGNLCKYHLGKISIYNGIGKKGGAKIDRHNVIDFNSSNGKLLSEIKTLWGQNFSEFHHEIFFKRYGDYISPLNVFDASEWFNYHGDTATGYYYEYLKLFLKDAVLFENFMLENEDERKFVEEVFLPSFNRIQKEFGYKPLIVSLEPTSIEGDEFWLSYPPAIQDEIAKKRGTIIE